VTTLVSKVPTLAPIAWPLLLAAVQPAAACQCQPVDEAKAFAAASAVYEVRLVSVQASAEAEQARFVVERVLKGSVGVTEVLRSHAGPLTYCAIDLRVGDRYRVFAGNESVVDVTFCGPTRRIESAPHPDAAGPPARVAFEQLKTLAGEWQSADPKSGTSVGIAALANGSALVETWTMSPTRQSMTVYTMDGNRLIATHYCPQGNAPRLGYSGTDASGAHHFEFLDGANLQSAEGFHEHAFWIRKDSGGTFTRSETYISNGAKYDPAKHTGSIETFSRAE